jgi:NAD-dependent DNA ligase
LEPVGPFTAILARLDRILADGECADDEREELRILMESVCGHTNASTQLETCSTTLPLDDPPPSTVVFPARAFSITGRFAFGTRWRVMEAIQSKGGVASDSPPTLQSHYLVIGAFASRDWANTNYGRKIERAVELRASGSGIAIISEEHWKQFVA